MASLPWGVSVLVGGTEGGGDKEDLVVDVERNRKGVEEIRMEHSQKPWRIFPIWKSFKTTEFL